MPLKPDFHECRVLKFIGDKMIQRTDVIVKVSKGSW